MQEDNYQKLRDYTLRLLSFRPRSTKEISVKLQKFTANRDFPNELIGKVINELTEQKFLDDKEFVRWWVDQRQSYRPKGIRAIKMELLNKGIEKEIIDEVLSEGSEEKISEYDLAMKVINKKLVNFNKLSHEKLKIKIRDHLLRRGFDWDVIRKVIDSRVKK